jgi:hypothetical protein
MNTTQTDSAAIANEIVRQLGNLTLSMLGANQLLSTETGLQFAIKGSRKVRKLVIDLDLASDTYSVKGWRKRGRFDWFCAETVTDVHVGELHRVIEGMTGLYTRL